MYGRVLEQRQKKKKNDRGHSVETPALPNKIFFDIIRSVQPNAESITASEFIFLHPSIFYFFFILVLLLVLLVYQYISIISIIFLERTATRANRHRDKPRLPPPRLLCARCLNLSSLSVRRRVKSIESFFSFFFFFMQQ